MNAYKNLLFVVVNLGYSAINLAADNPDRSGITNIIMPPRNAKTHIYDLENINQFESFLNEHNKALTDLDKECMLDSSLNHKNLKAAELLLGTGFIPGVTNLNRLRGYLTSQPLSPEQKLQCLCLIYQASVGKHKGELIINELLLAQAAQESTSDSDKK